MTTATDRSALIVPDSREHCLQQAAWHGGYAKCIISTIEQSARNGYPLNFESLEQQAARFARSGFRWAAGYLEALSSSGSSETPQQGGPMVFGSWPAHCEQRAFVEGAAWWEYFNRGGTMWSSDRTRAESEAIKRYGEPAAACTKRPGRSDG